jgi:hypothetical protein
VGAGPLPTHDLRAFGLRRINGPSALVLQRTYDLGLGMSAQTSRMAQHVGPRRALGYGSQGSV